MLQAGELVRVSGNPCGGGAEYLHRNPASSRRRQRGKSQIWDSKMWSRVPRDSDPRKTALARTSSIYKRQTRPVVREGAPEKQDRNCQTVINIWSWSPDGVRHQDNDRQSQCDFDLSQWSWVKWWVVGEWVSEWVSESVVESCCSWGWGQFWNPGYGERQPLKAATEQRLRKTEKTLCVL
jgi:hypothetical protein